MGVEKKVALITGGSRGIGKAIVGEFAQQGYRVAVNYVHNREQAEEQVSRIREAGGQAIAVQGNVADGEEANTLIQEVAAYFGRIDVLVNNAGITRDNLLMRMKEEDWDAVMNINLKGTYHCCKSIIKLMMKQKYGRIINITSVVGLMGNPGQTNYAASKAGVIGFTKSLAREVGGRNITVNAVAPGFIATAMTENLSERSREALLQQVPLQRLGQPEDVAYVVAFLASDQAGYITGQTIAVDGGMVMN